MNLLPLNQITRIHILQCLAALLLTSAPRDIMAQPTIRQDQSPLFATFPLEIRRVIYQQLWLDCGLTQHIFAIRERSYLLSFPCILGPEYLNTESGSLGAPDIPDDAAGAGDEPQTQDDSGGINSAIQDLSGGDPGGKSEPPSSTPRFAHFACFRSRLQKWDNSWMAMYMAMYSALNRWGEGPARTDLRGNVVLTTFLVCKGMYHEASESLFSSMRFSFTTVRAMDLFLSQVSRSLSSRVQAVDVCLLVEL